ncbi:MAG: S9 family peptidase [Pseudomonadota bacterium]
MRFIFSLVLLWAASSVSVFAQTDKPPLEAYGNLPLFSSVELSPDGTKVAAIANLEDGRRLIVMSDQGETLLQVSLGQIKARYVEFIDNDHAILMVSETTSTVGFRGDYEYSGAFVVPIKGGKPKQLLVGTEGIFPAQGGLGNIVGRGRKSSEILMPAYMGSSFSDPSYDLLRVKLKDGRGRVQNKGSADTRDWFTDGQGNAIAKVRYNNKSNTFRIEHLQGKDWVPIYQENDVRIPPFRVVGVLPDLSGVVHARPNKASEGFNELVKLGFDGSVTPLMSKPEKEILSVLVDSNRHVLGVLFSGMSPEYGLMDQALERAYSSVVEALPNATIWIDSWSDDRSKVMYSVFDPSIGDVWILQDITAGTIGVFAGNRDEIATDQIGPVYAIEYPARDGLKIPSVLTTPPGTELASGANLPLIVLPHGGPSSHDLLDFNWMAQYFANRGYLILQPNFRGSTGFGQQFLEAGRGEWGGKMQDDITDGVAAMVDGGYADPDNVCIVGASYGGYAALAGATFTPELYKCVIAIAPVSDLNMMLQNVKFESSRGHWVVDYWEGLMADGDARKQKLRSISPVNFADAVQAPVLLLHGDDDTVVPIGQSRTMERALKRADKNVQLVRLKGEDHWLSVPSTRLQTLVEMDRFISQHMPIVSAQPMVAPSAGAE